VKVRTWPHFSARVIFANFAATKLSLSFDMVVNGEGLVFDMSVSNSREFRSAGTGGFRKDGVRRKTPRQENGSGNASGEGRV
jgi:hypothetical protein